jgi:hypothetical protein
VREGEGSKGEGRSKEGSKERKNLKQWLLTFI